MRIISRVMKSLLFVDCVRVFNLDERSSTDGMLCSKKDISFYLSSFLVCSNGYTYKEMVIFVINSKSCSCILSYINKEMFIRQWKNLNF